LFVPGGVDLYSFSAPPTYLLDQFGAQALASYVWTGAPAPGYLNPNRGYLGDIEFIPGPFGGYTGVNTGNSSPASDVGFLNQTARLAPDVLLPLYALSDPITVASSSPSEATLTQGYWKSHPEAWPVTSLTLGAVSYTHTQLLQILHTPVSGNGLIALAHQLIAAKLNVASGANPSAISSTIVAADALIGSLVVPPVGTGFLKPSVTSAHVRTLDDWNNGVIGPGHCGSS